MSKRRSSREILQERTYPVSIYEFPNFTYLCRYCGKPVLREQLEEGEAIEDDEQRYDDQGKLETYAYRYYHQRCKDSYEHRIGLEKLRKMYRRGY